MNWDQVEWKGASASNFTVGRQGNVPKYITFHHAVGTMESVLQAWSNPARQGSSHFAVGARGAWQFVDTDNTAWCNGDWNSNLVSISIEHEGDWRFGYTNEECIEQSAQLVALLRKTHPTIVGFNRHRDIFGTQCPGDLPCERIWDRATQIMNPPVVVPPVAPPTPPISSVQVLDIQNRKVALNKDAHLWDLSFTTWADAKSVKVIPYIDKTTDKPTEIEVSATAKHPLGGLYYLSEYSFSKGTMNGINSADCDEISVKPVDPPVVVEPPVEPPVIVEPPIVIEPPIVTPPVTPEAPNIWKLLIALIKFLLRIKK